jgi:hypothetical protein
MIFKTTSELSLLEPRVKRRKYQLSAEEELLKLTVRQQRRYRQLRFLQSVFSCLSFGTLSHRKHSLLPRRHGNRQFYALSVCQLNRRVLTLGARLDKGRVLELRLVQHKPLTSSTSTGSVRERCEEDQEEFRLVYGAQQHATARSLQS